MFSVSSLQCCGLVCDCSISWELEVLGLSLDWDIELCPWVRHFHRDQSCLSSIPQNIKNIYFTAYFNIYLIAYFNLHCISCAGILLSLKIFYLHCLALVITQETLVQYYHHWLNWIFSNNLNRQHTLLLFLFFPFANISKRILWQNKW